MPSVPETLFLLIHLPFDPSVSYIIHPLPKLSSYVKLHVFPCSSSKFSFSYFTSIPLLLGLRSNGRGHHEQRSQWRKKHLCGATGEGLRRETSKCLFMANWATDEPAAISDNGLSRMEWETSMKEGKEIGDREVLQRGT